MVSTLWLFGGERQDFYGLPLRASHTAQQRGMDKR